MSSEEESGDITMGGLNVEVRRTSVVTQHCSDVSAITVDELEWDMSSLGTTLRGCGVASSWCA